MKMFEFPTEQYFCFCVEDNIFEEFKSLIDNLFMISKLKDYHIQMEEKTRWFEILIVSRIKRIEISIFFNNLMVLEDIMCEWVVFDNKQRIIEEKQSQQGIDWLEKINKLKEVIEII